MAPAQKQKLWKSIVCPAAELQLKATLDGGQSFRWKRHSGDADCWIGVMANCVWKLRQTPKELQYQVLGELPYPHSTAFCEVRMKVPPPKTSTGRSNTLLYADKYYQQLLRSYFRLDDCLAALYEHWAEAHPHFRTEAAQFYAIRQLNQEPVENLFSFICSQNNNIARISMLVEKLCTLYGPLICSVDGVDYHAFPDCSALCALEVDARLRAEKFGYRAKFIQQSAAQIMERGHLEWFDRLQRMDYDRAHGELVQLCGIGPKVADCICLMSLGHLGAIPVDTHVYQIAAKHYMDGKLKPTCKSINATMYATIGRRFREVYGDLAGWAQTVLFCADLAKFRESPKKADDIKSKGSDEQTVIAPKRSKKCT